MHCCHDKSRFRFTRFFAETPHSKTPIRSGTFFRSVPGTAGWEVHHPSEVSTKSCPIHEVTIGQGTKCHHHKLEVSSSTGAARFLGLSFAVKGQLEVFLSYQARQWAKLACFTRSQFADRASLELCCVLVEFARRVSRVLYSRSTGSWQFQETGHQGTLPRGDMSVSGALVPREPTQIDVHR